MPTCGKPAAMTILPHMTQGTYGCTRISRVQIDDVVAPRWRDSPCNARYKVPWVKKLKQQKDRGIVPVRRSLVRRCNSTERLACPNSEINQAASDTITLCGQIILAIVAKEGARVGEGAQLCLVRAPSPLSSSRRQAVSSGMSAPGVRRDKAALSSGCKSHPATAPAGSNRSSHGGNEVAEAYG